MTKRHGGQKSTEGEVMPLPEREWMSIREVGEMLGLTYKTVYGLVRSTAIPAYRIGGSIRIPRAKLIAWVEQAVVNANPLQEE